jgi:hypothetical protein
MKAAAAGSPGVQAGSAPRPAFDAIERGEPEHDLFHVIEAPTYEAPNYPGPTFRAPVYDAPIYDAPTFLAPIYEQPTYDSCKTLPAREARSRPRAGMEVTSVRWRRMKGEAAPPGLRAG